MLADAIPSQEAVTSLRAALVAARAALTSSETADLDAQTLLAYVLGVDRSYLFTRPEHALTSDQTARFRALVRRRAAGEPIAYITGRRGFYDIDLLVRPAVLIPRPETELLLEEALDLSDNQPGYANMSRSPPPIARPRAPARREGESSAASRVVGVGGCAAWRVYTVADIGTGSGALAVAFARRRPAATVYATDICGAALAIARENAARHHVDLTLLQGDLAQPLIKRGIQVDLLLANLPYIASDELAELAVSRFEPRLALDGGPDGLALIRRLMAQAPDVCGPRAVILLEIGADQGAAVSEMAREILGADCDIRPDYAGLDRIARIQL